MEAEADEAQAENSSDENTVSAADAAEEDQTVSSAQNARAAAHEETVGSTEDAGQSAGNVEAGADEAQDENCSAENTVSAAGAAEKDQAVSSAQGACSGTASGESPIGSGPRTLIPDDDDRLRSSHGTMLWSDGKCYEIRSSAGFSTSRKSISYHPVMADISMFFTVPFAPLLAGP